VDLDGEQVRTGNQPEPIFTSPTSCAERPGLRHDHQRQRDQGRPCPGRQDHRERRHLCAPRHDLPGEHQPHRGPCQRRPWNTALARLGKSIAAASPGLRSHLAQPQRAPAVPELKTSSSVAGHWNPRKVRGGYSISNHRGGRLYGFGEALKARWAIIPSSPWGARSPAANYLVTPAPREAAAEPGWGFLLAIQARL
jgi:hypothetical protein